MSPELMIHVYREDADLERLVRTHRGLAAPRDVFHVLLVEEIERTRLDVPVVDQ